MGLYCALYILFVFRDLRRRLPSKILTSLCFSLMAFLIVFLADVERAEIRISCQIIAGVLHYLMLASFMWMCVTAVNLYQLLVLVFRSSNEKKFFIRASIVAWGRVTLEFFDLFLHIRHKLL